MISGSGSATYFTNSTTYEKFGYNLYAGDARTTPVSSLTLIDGCDSLLSNGLYPDWKTYACSQLQPNTTYTVQLFFHKNFNNSVRVAVAFDGTAPTQAPEPVLSLVPASNKLGTLPSNNANGVTTTVTDQLACNSRHSIHPVTRHCLLMVYFIATLAITIISALSLLSPFPLHRGFG